MAHKITIPTLVQRVERILQANCMHFTGRLREIQILTLRPLYLPVIDAKGCIAKYTITSLKKITPQKTYLKVSTPI